MPNEDDNRNREFGVKGSLFGVKYTLYSHFVASCYRHTRVNLIPPHLSAHNVIQSWVRSS